MLLQDATKCTTLFRPSLLQGEEPLQTASVSSAALDNPKTLQILIDVPVIVHTKTT